MEPPARPRPAFVIRLPLESYGRVCCDAETHEDQQRLILWLERSDTIPMLCTYLAGLAEWLREEAA